MSTLTVTAPNGAHFEFESVKTKGGTVDLGEKPILVWDSLDAAIAYYGEEGTLAILDGTSLRVSFQNIARRKAAAGKSDDEIAKDQIDFRPGKRVVGASTPASRAKRAVGAAIEKNPDAADAIERLLAKIQAGELSNADIEAMAQ